MRRRPVLLDLYCKAGGAGMGYALAGFDVVGVDRDPQPRYPFPFIRADVLTLPPWWVAAFDAVHASPPCQFGTAMNNDKSRHTNLIPPTRALLTAAGRPFVIENVEGALAHLRAPLVLCGTAFGLGASAYGRWYELQRHRGFELGGWTCPAPGPCAHTGGPVLGVYGGHARSRGGAEREATRSFPGLSQRALAREALGMAWGTLDDLSEAIPPAYTLYLGTHLLRSLEHGGNLG